MKRLLTLTALLATFSAASFAAAAPLAANLPAGALVTLEANHAGPAIDRLLGLVGQLGAKAGLGDASDTIDGVGGLLKMMIGEEATAGVYSVSDGKGGYAPGLLAVSRVDRASQGFVSSMLPRKVGARVGRYTFARSGSFYAGLSNGLLYVASDKSLLMGYLGRLSGKAAPRLNDSSAYTAPRSAVGEQQLGLYLNFSATAKVIRSQLAKVMLPRLLSPIVDALDTLGQYAAGFTTTDAGLSARSAEAPNGEGKDKPLYNILTHATDFQVQNVIPASALSVTASACAPQTAAYTARWLNRIDLFDPFGFLSDSQLADHLEGSSRYLGDECAQVSFPGKSTGLLNATFQRVTDMEAAQAAMPEYADSVNAAIGSFTDNLTGLYSGLADTLGSGNGKASQMSRALGKSTQADLGSLKASLAKLKMVYAFKGDYLVTAYSQDALDAAMQDGGALADDREFVAADLALQDTPGWSYGRALPELKVADVLKTLQASGGLSQAGLSPKEIRPIAGAVADLYNRYGGMSSQSSTEDGLILSTSNVRYEW